MKMEEKWLKSVSRHYDEVIAMVQKPIKHTLFFLGSGEQLGTVCSKKFKKRWWLNERMFSVYDRAEKWLSEQVKLIEEREKVDIVWTYEKKIEIDIQRGNKKVKTNGK